MSTLTKPLSPSRQAAVKAFDAIVRILKAAGGSMRKKELFEKVEKEVQFNEWENAPNEKGVPRWVYISGFYTIPLDKAGYLIKNKGLWTLTPEGENASRKGMAEMLEEAVITYKKWHKENITDEKQNGSQHDEEIEEDKINELNFEEYEEEAIEGIREFIKRKNPYEFQDSVAALLNAMGYYISFIAPPGKDGGIDIIAYNDPLGTRPPRIVVQVKHKPETNISSDEIQKLVGTMRRDSDVGIFVTTGEFSNPAKQEARNSGKHVELIGFTRFIELWIQYYDKMNDEQKNMLPLQPIYFLRAGDS